MSQADEWDLPSGPPCSPSDMVAALQDNFDALRSLHKGASRPSYAQAGTMWIDDSPAPWTLMLFDGNTDIVMGKIDPSTHAIRYSGSRAGIAKLTNSADTTLGSASPTKVSLGTTVSDPDGNVAFPASGRLVPPVGPCRFTGQVLFGGTNLVVGSAIYVYLARSGAIVPYAGFWTRVADANSQCLSFSAQVTVGSGDYFELWARKDGAGAGTVLNSTFTYLEVEPL